VCVCVCVQHELNQVRNLRLPSRLPKLNPFILAIHCFVMYFSTFINVGGDYSIVKGDHPLIVVAPNTVVQCGLDGHRNNSCVLNGGFLQVLLQTQLPGIKHEVSDYGFLEKNYIVDNVTIRGLTFTGDTVASGPLEGLSFLMSQSGNVTIEDCRWTDMTAVSNIIGVGKNKFQASQIGGFADVPKHSAELIIRNCQFDNIVYDNPMIHTQTQTIHVENCKFINITTSLLPNVNCGSLNFGGCAMLLACENGGKCSFSQSCIENVGTLGPGLLYGSSPNNFIPPKVPLHKDEIFNDEIFNSSMIESIFSDDFIPPSPSQRRF
jgi:hypothetical protein